MSPSLPLTSALAPLAKEQGVDLSKLAAAEIEFERKLAETREWLRRPIAHTGSRGEEI